MWIQNYISSFNVQSQIRVTSKSNYPTTALHYQASKKETSDEKLKTKEITSNLEKNYYYYI